MSKKVNTKDWRNLDIKEWNNTTFTEYLKDKHFELFGISYAPFGGTWGLEQGIIGTLIGTSSKKNPKPRTASNESVKDFIDKTFESYSPNKQYPGTSFGFMWTYRKNVWQQIESQVRLEEVSDEAKYAAPKYEDIAKWL